MSSYSDANAFSRVHVMQRVMDSMRNEGFSMDKIIQYSMLAQMEEEGNDEPLELVSDYDVQWDIDQQKYVLHKKKSRQISYAEFIDHWDFGGIVESDHDSEDEDSEAERQDSVLEEEKNKIKAEKKRLKKQRQKKKRRQQKERESPPTQDRETMGVDNASSIDKTGNELSNDKTEDCLNLKDMATALESDCSDDTLDGSSDEENEGLDLTSSFVSKAAEIVKRQLEQKQEIKDKKKSPVKEEQKMPEKSTCEESHIKNHVEKDTLTLSPKMEDFKKISNELATIGNKQASAGNFKLAVTYITDAIKFNPTEFRLFGNRAFCFEKLQEFDKALNDAELSLSMSPGWVKGLFRKGRALAGLKRFEEAANAFKEVIKLDRSCTEANQELLRMQILQLMEHGFTQEQCTKALILHGSVDEAWEVLSKLKSQSVSPVAPVALQQVVNMTGLSPILSAKMTSAATAVPTVPRSPGRGASKTAPEPLLPLTNQPTQAKPADSLPSKPYHVQQAPELFPIWVGNLSFSVTESLLSKLFNKVGTVFSMKHLPAKRCAFINFTQPQDCDAAIRIYHGYELLGMKLAVRYPDRMPSGMNISRSAQISTDVQDEHLGPTLFSAGRNGHIKPCNPPNCRGPYKY